MLNRPHGRTTLGKMMTRVEVDALAAEAVAGDDLDERLARRGRRRRLPLGREPHRSSRSASTRI